MLRSTVVRQDASFPIPVPEPTTSVVTRRPCVQSVGRESSPEVGGLVTDRRDRRPLPGTLVLSGRTRFVTEVSVIDPVPPSERATKRNHTTRVKDWQGHEQCHSSFSSPSRVWNTENVSKRKFVSETSRIRHGRESVES